MSSLLRRAQVFLTLSCKQGCLPDICLSSRGMVTASLFDMCVPLGKHTLLENLHLKTPNHHVIPFNSKLWWVGPGGVKIFFSSFFMCV